ncbi:unnamed protein product [Rotaria sp. Silwood2]|nr:unnamed protein product [Rotaria sp. Silwood2]CAF4058017.1 unnamed protein product [Rotaria sp. Silwood2]CAF4576298.1 unnamed protein product [Rotaria sp. Silwood2]CAF4693743.1 unnamed protein product [Rotaria sp. Silwood2]
MFIGAAQKQALNELGQHFIMLLRVAYVYDIGTTLDETYDHGVVKLIIQDSVEQCQNNAKFEDDLLKTDAQVEETIKQAQK